MHSAAHAHSLPIATISERWMLWIGRSLSALVIVGMAVSASMKFAQPPLVVEMFTGKFGYHQEVLVVLGVVELLCALLYAIPRTAVLGAVLLTGYLGGAVATHVRVADVFVIPLFLGVIAWGGLYFRDERVRDLLPFRRMS